MNNSRYTSPDIESFVVSYLLSNPKKIINYIDLIRLENFSDPRLAEVVKAIKSVSTNNPEPEVEMLGFERYPELKQEESKKDILEQTQKFEPPKLKMKM